MRTQRRTWSIKIRISLLTHRRRASRRFPDRRDTCFASLSCCAIVHSSLQLPPLSHFHDHDDLSSFVKIRAPSLSLSLSLFLSLSFARAPRRGRVGGGRRTRSQFQDRDGITFINGSSSIGQYFWINSPPLFPRRRGSIRRENQILINRGEESNRGTESY